MKKILFSIVIFILFFFTFNKKALAAVAIIHVGSQQQTGYPISFDGSKSTGKNPMGTDGDIYGIQTYAWNFGDGTIESGEYLNTQTHTYNSPGAYTINLRVTDYHGNSATTSASITVGTLPKATVSGSTGSAISSAISSLGGQPGIVYIPAGNYSITSAISIPSGVIIEGVGKENTILNISSGTGFSIGGDNIRITGVQIKGVESNYGVECQTKNNLYIDHSDMRDFYYANGITYYCSATFEHNYIHSNNISDGYGIMVTSGAYIMVRNNEFSNNRHSIASGGRGDEPGWNTGYDFINNHIELDKEVQNVDVALDGHAGIQGRIRISDNVIENVRYGIGLRDGWGEIRRNTFRNVSSYILKFDVASYAGSGGGSVSGGGLHDFYIDHNTVIASGTQWRILSAVRNIYLNCRKIDSLIPYTGSAPWNDCGTPSPSPSPSPGVNPSPSPSPSPSPITSPLPGFSWEAENGNITSPFTVTNGYVSQSSYAGEPPLGGRASYQFNITNPGNYVIKTIVNAPDDGTNSFYVNIDNEPINPAMVWDIPLTSGFEQRTVSWRGGGTYDNSEFVPKVFTLSAGEHQLIIRGREANAKLDKLSVELLTPLSCSQDLNGDKIINVADIFAALQAWGSCPGCQEDLNGDNTVNVADIIQILEAWGSC